MRRRFGAAEQMKEKSGPHLFTTKSPAICRLCAYTPLVRRGGGEKVVDGGDGTVDASMTSGDDPADFFTTEKISGDAGSLRRIDCSSPEPLAVGASVGTTRLAFPLGNFLRRR